MKRTTLAILLLFSGALFTGCTDALMKTAPTAGGDSAHTQAEPAQPAAQGEPNVVEVATVAGVGVTGRGEYGDAPAIMRPITVPVSAYFRTLDRTVFEMLIPHTMNLFQASEGRRPNSHEEFMQRIIVEGGITLPTLQNPGDEYRYDPATGQLMVITRQ